MTFTLWRKLLRDIRVPLLVVALLLLGFEIIWVKVVQRLTGEIVPMLSLVSAMAGRASDWLLDLFFRGPGKLIQTFLGGEHIQFGNPQELLAIGFMHPLVQAMICIWAVGRAGGAIAGEIDRGTMELLLAQPIRRSRVIAAHLLVDLTALPLLCLALWAGSAAGAELFSPFQVEPGIYYELRVPPPNPMPVMAVHSNILGPALWNVGALLFAVSGYTMWISSWGRSRNRVIGVAILVTLIQFILNVIGQLWDGAEFLRPFTVFYYYQPQRIALENVWTVDPGLLWRGKPLIELNVVAVLIGVGFVGYLLAWRHFRKRDIPAPL
jgi:beta-exotoxin I transport system permease protein